VPFAPQRVPLRCQGITISVGAAALGLVMTCDCKSIMKTPIRRPFLLPPGLVIRLLRTWAYAPSVHTFLSHSPHEVLLASTIEPAAVIHLPTLVLGVQWMATFRIGPSKLYPVTPGCSFRSTATERVTFPSVVRCCMAQGHPPLLNSARSITPHSAVLQYTRFGHTTGNT
jgi:hypothetical protein